MSAGVPERRGYLQDAARLLDDGVGWAGLGGDALAFVLGDIAANGRWLVVVDGTDRAELLARALRFFHPKPSRVVSFPADDCRPYDGFSAHPRLAQQRLYALQRVDGGRPLVVVAPVRALLQRVPDRATRRLGTRVIRAGDTLDRDDFAGWLGHAGYLAAGRVDAPGCFAIRGDVIDLWSAGMPAPARIDLFDDEVEELRRVDPASHRAGRSLRQVIVLPAREERLDEPALDRLHRELGRLVREQQRGVALRRRVFEELKAGIRFSALEDYLPALVPTVEPLDTLGALRTIVADPADVAAAVRDFHSTAQRRWESLDDQERPLLPPHERYVAADAVMERLEQAHPVFGIAAEGRAVDLGARPVDGFAVRGTELGPVVSRIDKLAAAEARVALVVDGGKRAERLLDLLAPHGLRPKVRPSVHELERGEVSLLVGDLPRGFVAPESGWAVISVSALFGAVRRARRSERAHTLFTSGVTSMAQLKVDDHVVHRLHGIGVYRGLVRLPVQGEVEQDFVRLEYRGGDLLFLPVTALEQLSRYAPARSGATVRLDRLGGATWARRKGKVRDSLLKMAEELLRLYARRELASRPPVDPAGGMYRAFEARFPYEETPDQAAAIEAVHEDLDQPYPMDRLVCGDVGFGKTEVAMRAAMRVVEAGRQVAVLCPTTVLAHQHLRTFRERFQGFPVAVEMLSRFVAPADEKQVRAGLAAGDVDVVVGTTALLGRRVRFQDLGLVVIDEEHRFGVKQKDRLKRLRTEVDVLSMSATPIPRTLQMALSGMRQMSVMATPPQDRLAVRTQVARMTPARVRDAISQEVQRGGQVFVIHNRVETIDRFAEQLREWVPDVSFAVAHGQMDDRALERVLVDFTERRHQVLVCTAIIESGIDMPSVNTMLVHRADRFGLAQLYQLRGRVGRAAVRATCLLLVPESITSDARKRLRILVENTRLGSGFQVAAADLELRGGGNLLGGAQSGNIDKVGYDVWVELLEGAVRSARGDLDRERIDPEIEVPVPAFIPDNLITDVQERLQWYRRLSGAPSADGVDALLDELEGFVGDLPEEVRNLGGLMATRLQCRELGIVRCSWLKVRVLLELHPSTRLTDARLASVCKRHPKRFVVRRREGEPVVVEVRFTPREGQRPFRYLRWTFSQLSR